MPRIDLTTDYDTFDRLRNTGVVEVSSDAPNVPATGTVWLDTDDITTPTVALVTITIDTLLDSSNHHVFCDTSSGPIVVTLPPAADHTGRPFVITNIGRSPVTVVGTINGASSQVLGAGFPSMPIMSNGSEYRIAGG